MFGNSFNGNNNNSRNVNTRIKTFFGETACLQLTYWNETISIRINPFKDLDSDGVRQYDYNRRANTALTSEKCLAMASRVKELILPAIEDVKKTKTLKEPVSTGVQVGNSGSAICLEYKNDDKGIPFVFLTVYTNIGQDGKAPKDGVFSYKFNKTNVTDNYNPDTGTGTENVVETEFLFFYEKIRKIADMFGTTAHNINNEAAYKSNYKQNGNNGAGGANSFQNNYQNNSNSSNNYSAPVSSFSGEGLPF